MLGEAILDLPQLLPQLIHAQRDGFEPPRTGGSASRIANIGGHWLVPRARESADPKAPVGRDPRFRVTVVNRRADHAFKQANHDGGIKWSCRLQPCCKRRALMWTFY